MSAFTNIVNGSLKTKLIELIRLRGPMSVADYMKIVLTNPESGFYMNNDVFGVKGHFTTNPEISQMFGEILGVWIMQEWRRFSCPKPLKLVEFGPGRGTLMSDITRTLAAFKETHGNVNLAMIEMSPHLQELQKSAITDKTLLEKTTWHTAIGGLPEDGQGFTAYIAHEYLDALPVHKFVRDSKLPNKPWRELLIDYDQKDELRFCISRAPSLATHLLVPEEFEGDQIEVCPEAGAQLEKVASRLNETGKGCMLICDYGFEDEPQQDQNTNYRHPRDTFRAFKNHQIWPPLSDPGEADLTADVDFGYLKGILKDKATVFGSVTQKNFLVNCGLQTRLNVLLKNTSDKKSKQELISESKMMLEEMGERYRLLAFFPKESKHLFNKDPPAGFNTSPSGS